MEVYVEEEHFKELEKKGMKPEYIYQMGEDGILSSSHAGDESVSDLKSRSIDEKKMSSLGRFDGTKVVPLQCIKK